MKRLNKHTLYTSLLLIVIILLCFGLYSRRSRRIEVHGELLSVQNKTAYFLNAERGEYVLSALYLETHKSREFLRLPVENVDRNTFRFAADSFYYFQGQRDKSALIGEPLWKQGRILRVPLHGGKPELIVANAHTGWFKIVPPIHYRTLF